MSDIFTLLLAVFLAPVEFAAFIVGAATALIWKFARAGYLTICNSVEEAAKWPPSASVK